VKPRPPLPGGPWLVVGLARSGLAAGRALVARGESVVGVDAGTPDVDAPFPVRLGTDGLAELENAAAVVKSPGVPREAPVIDEARRRGLPVLGELEFAWRILGERDWIVVTGTNGKTTTTELIGAIHRAAGLPHAVVGNVGTAASELAAAYLAPDAVVVAEASSFQLEDTLELAPEAAVLLNLVPDHLDRHGTFADYRAAKLQAFARQGPEDIAVAPFAVPGDAERVALGRRGEMLTWLGEPLLDEREIRLRGAHNLENAMAAAAVTLARGVGAGPVAEALRTFAGVPHRLEEVAERDGVLYVNDSKATNVDSTLVALRAFPAGSIHLILGGQGKEQDFSPLREPIRETVAGVYLIGEDARIIEAALDGGVHAGTLERAVGLARQRAKAGDVILLSPASASFDQFRDYEARGEAFRALARQD
jgi:UDP-N-acetylmuramoylalanine--D-glutamate ligase